MASDYLSIEEVCEKLGMTEEQVKALVGDGKLREFRDGGKVLYQADEVDLVAGKEGSSVVDLDATDEAVPTEIDLDESESFASALSDLADSSVSLGALDESPVIESPPEINLGEDKEDDAFAFADESDSADEINISDIPEELPAAPADPGSLSASSEIDLLPANDEGEAIAASVPETSDASGGADDFPDVPDLGLSGSSIISLEPSDSGAAMDSPVAKEDTKVGKVGISVFDDDEIEVETDPMGETQISAGVDDFDAVGSGSGLLDLTQEPDDSSLGAELLDVISPSDAGETADEVEAVEALVEDDDDAVAVMEDNDMIAAVSAPAVSAPKSRVAAGEMAGAVPMNVCLFLGLLGLALVGFATASVIQGVWPAAVMDYISKGVIHYSVFGGLALVSIVAGVISIVSGRK